MSTGQKRDGKIKDRGGRKRNGESPFSRKDQIPCSYPYRFPSVNRATRISPTKTRPSGSDLCIKDISAKYFTARVSRECNVKMIKLAAKEGAEREEDIQWEEPGTNECDSAKPIKVFRSQKDNLARKMYRRF